MAVWYEELEGSPTINMDRRGGSAQRKVRIAWGDIDAFFQELFPDPFFGYTGAFFPGYPWLVVDSVAVEPFDPNNPTGQNEAINTFPAGARVTVNYKPPELDQGHQGGPTGDRSGPGGTTGSAGNQQGQSQTFVTHKVSAGGEFITWPSKNLRWMRAANGLDTPNQPQPEREYDVAADSSAAVAIPLLEHSISWGSVEWPPWTAIRQCLGKVNAYSFAGAGPGTLLFLGCDASRELTSTGVKAWNLEYKLSEKNVNSANPALPMGWNYFLRPDGVNAGSFDLLFRKPPMIDLGNGQKGAPQTVLSAPVTAEQATINVANDSKFPRVGQFRVVIDAGTANVEEVAVIAGQGSNTWAVLRGLGGDRKRPHAANAPVASFPGRIYEVADLRYLFLPSMPIV